jgi:serine/threonine-protein kinase HipA
MTEALPEEEFAVRLHGRRIGALRRVGDVTRFGFDESYLEDPQRPVLGLRFEEGLRARHSAHLRLPPWFSNLLPEGQLREWIAHARGASLLREMELLAQVGHDLPGAVQVVPAGALGNDETRFEREVMSDVAPRLPPSLWRFSLAGVALKFSMREKAGQFAAPAVGEGGDWIVKLPDIVHPHVPVNEFAMMTFAKAVGIDAPEVRLVHRDLIEPLPDELWPRGEEFAYAVRRFDRGPERELIHIEDLAQVRGFYPDDKYRGSFETVASYIYRGRDSGALREFARRLAFYVMIENGDAHLKNWSLIYRDPRAPTLSPAYDLVATSVYRPSHEPEDLGLKFCGSRRFQTIAPSCFTRLESRLGVSIGLAEEVMSLVERTLTTWPEVAALLKDHPVMVQKIEASLNLHAQRLRGVSTVNE